MVVVGLADGAEPGVALMSGDRLVSVERVGRRRPVWAVVKEQLARASLAPSDVELLAIAGRFTPPMVVRKTAWAQWDPFGAAASTAVRAERVLRRTGLGAAEADRVGEWFTDQARQHGITPRRVSVVDIHQALAAAAYRTQPADTVLVLVVLPRGDGAFASVHVGKAGRLDRLALESHRTAVHLWLDRARGRLGLEEHELFRASGPPDPRLASLLERSFRFDGTAFAADAGSRVQTPWRELGGVDRWVGAATVLHVFRRTMLQWIEHHRRTPPGVPDAAALARKQPQIALGGVLASDPRLVAAVAELPGVRAVWAGPWTGSGALAVGAALATAAPAPQLIASPSRPLVPVEPGGSLEEAVDQLASGESVRFGPTRDTWVRADDGAAVDRARRRVGISEYEGLEVLAEPGRIRVQKAGLLTGPLLHGTASPLVDDPQVRGVPAVDGRIRVRWADPAEQQVLVALRERTGVGAVAILPDRSVGGGLTQRVPRE